MLDQRVRTLRRLPSGAVGCPLRVGREASLPIEDVPRTFHGGGPQAEVSPDSKPSAKMIESAMPVTSLKSPLPTVSESHARKVWDPVLGLPVSARSATPQSSELLPSTRQR